MKKQFAILLSVLLMLCACQSPKEKPASPPLPKYEIASCDTREYMGDTYCDYAILISEDSTDEEILSVARFLLNDGYYQHKFLFYRAEEELNGMYTVALIKEDDDGSLTLNRKGGLVQYRDDFYPDSSSSESTAS